MLKNKIEIFKGILLFILAIIFVLLILEGFFRIFSPLKFQSFIELSRTTMKHNASFFRTNRVWGYEFIPNSLFCNGVNSLGMLDRERIGRKAEDVYRIICLGDSTTACSDYSSILEDMLNANANGEKFEVWNCGVPAYATIQYCQTLKKKWLKYGPDMVIIGFCLNDFDFTPLVRREGNSLVGYFPNQEIMSYVDPFLLEYSALYRFIILRLFVSKKYDKDRDTVKFSCSYLKGVKDLLSERKIGFLIVILGIVEPFENYPHWKRNYTAIKDAVEDCNIESIDMVPIFVNSGLKNLQLLPGDELHFNRNASQFVANAIYDYLKQRFAVHEREI